MRSALADTPIETVNGALQVTVSIGLATHTPARNAVAIASEVGLAERMENLQQRADQALYQVKSTGRNCVRDA